MHVCVFVETFKLFIHLCWLTLNNNLIPHLPLTLCAIIIQHPDNVTTERQLSDKEIKVLKYDLKQLDKKKSTQVKFLSIWTIIAIFAGIFFYFRLETVNEQYLLAGTVTIYILIGVWSFGKSLIDINRKRKSIDFVFKNNKVNSIIVISKDCIELSEVEDEGVYYLFQLADNKILSFGGQEFYPTKKFPNDNFEIVFCCGLKGEIVLLETFIYGDKLAPKKIITGHRKFELIGSSNYPNPEKFTIIEGQLEKFETILF